MFFIISGIYTEIFAHHCNTLDSVGISQQGDKKYVIHQIEAGETLYGLSRKYGVSVDDIKSANKEEALHLKIGQRVFIPVDSAQPKVSGKIHTVSSSETLFSISRMYNVKVDDIKNWNHLSGNDIAVGQKLVIVGEGVENDDRYANNQVSDGAHTHIVQQSQTLYSISRMYNVTPEQLQRWNNLATNELKIGQKLVVAAIEDRTTEASKPSGHSSMLPTQETMQKNDTSLIKNDRELGAATATTTASTTYAATINSQIHDAPELASTVKPSQKVVEAGMAEVIENTEDTKKYLALHRKAPIGTIMQVRNKMNDRSVFVRIVGPFPETGDNAKLILKISKKAYDRLGAVDSRFPVEVSYIP